MNEIDTYKARLGLTPHSNFSFEVIEHERWEHAELNNSLFNGSVRLSPPGWCRIEAPHRRFTQNFG